MKTKEKPEVRYAMLHPGQGAQNPGMALDLYTASPAVRKLFSMASDIASKNLFTVMASGTEEELKKTENTQLAVALASRAAVIRAGELGIETACCAGFSLGELPALVCAGVLDDERLFSILVERGRCMSQAVEMLCADGVRPGMAVVIGLGFSRVKEILEEENVQGIYCANDNSPAQVVLAGDVGKMDALAGVLIARGARRVMPLKVSGPFHTPLMEKAVEPFATFLEGISFSEPVLPIASSVSGEWVESGADARHNCAIQLSSPVVWTRVMDALRQRQRELGFSCLLETGPGTVLAGLWGREAACPVYPGGTENDLQGISLQGIKGKENG
ncbi:ACP S-malonyltransferase [Parasphaerochaeta coccoides]|uniref:Malonyl CoA-acyl carrier protein transacylase n=1 Tax=Parasphaerochaeta coccoides (strain ATCC BAA-1237 / DSM 17374 / SPN1) TaxID=760011 RepID=F4GJL7_PARC1|nr:ACP S-malonyltransferase [Parasphaerochaeta coccoides]AEC02764.1 (Acyl-carrier-protein) S-malonyltransferase [Parasphaerochaeta coccoides DSM 17374]